MSMHNSNIQIEVVKGGFILTYPVQIKTEDGGELWDIEREVFVSPRKLNNKIKSVIDTIGLVSDND